MILKPRTSPVVMHRYWSIPVRVMQHIGWERFWVITGYYVIGRTPPPLTAFGGAMHTYGAATIKHIRQQSSYG